MPFDRFRHHRRSTRLPGYDYAQPGAYFVTVCAMGRECLFGAVRDGQVVCSEFGEVVESCWHRIPEHFPCVETDAFVVMPNHINGIILMLDGEAKEGESTVRQSA